MTMSSSGCDKNHAFFLVQSGIVLWEEPRPVVGWKWKTLSVVSKRLSIAIDLLWAIVASRPERFGGVYRFCVSPMPAWWTASQKRRAVANLSLNPSGFSETVLNIASEHACVTSALCNATAVDPNYLTAYRQCALLEVDESTRSAAEFLGEACKTVADLGTSGVEYLLGSTGAVAVLRVLERESHVALQLIGTAEVSDAAIHRLAETGIRRCHDMSGLPQEIANLST
jgi:hypothetical protein